MGVSTITVRPKLNLLDARRIDETVYVGNRSNLARDQIINLHPAILTEKGSARLSMISIGDQNGQRVSKWTEKYSVRVGQSQKWVKLNGVVSSNALRPLIILGDWAKYFNSFDDAGTFGYDPAQTNDNGCGSKNVITSLACNKQLVIGNISQHADVFPGCMAAIFSPTGKHVMLRPDGRLYVCFTTIYGGTYQWAYCAKSTDGGRTWSFITIDDSYGGNQANLSMVMDKNGNIFFIWNEYMLGDANHRHARIRKLKPDDTWAGAAVNVDTSSSGEYNVDTNLQVKSDGVTIAITWAGHGYGTDIFALNILYRERYANGTFSGITAITTDGVNVNKDYRYPSLDFDDDGYRHFSLITNNDAGTVVNLWYIQETGGGLQPIVQLNTEDANNLYTSSNILIDIYGRVNIAYTIYDASLNFPLYLKRKAPGGAWSGRITIEAGVGVTTGALNPQIQSDERDALFVVYDSTTNASPKWMAYKTVDRNNNASARYYLITMPAGWRSVVPQIPWSNYPVFDSIRSNLPQQYMILVYVEYVIGSPAIGNLMFYADPNVVLGAPALPPGMDKYTYNIRGAFNRTKFNSGFNPSV